uniref:Uncharacterized protein n=1 Tax=Oryza barthii TaxID=65489 RepID=A0A0D3GLC1_9ORYZ
MEKRNRRWAHTARNRKPRHPSAPPCPLPPPPALHRSAPRRRQRPRCRRRRCLGESRRIRQRPRPPRALARARMWRPRELKKSGTQQLDRSARPTSSFSSIQEQSSLDLCSASKLPCICQAPFLSSSCIEKLHNLSTFHESHFLI